MGRAGARLIGLCAGAAGAAALPDAAIGAWANVGCSTGAGGTTGGGALGSRIGRPGGGAATCGSPWERTGGLRMNERLGGAAASPGAALRAARATADPAGGGGGMRPGSARTAVASFASASAKVRPLAEEADSRSAAGIFSGGAAGDGSDGSGARASGASRKCALTLSASSSSMELECDLLSSIPISAK